MQISIGLYSFYSVAVKPSSFFLKKKLKDCVKVDGFSVWPYQIVISHLSYQLLLQIVLLRDMVSKVHFSVTCQKASNHYWILIRGDEKSVSHHIAYCTRVYRRCKKRLSILTVSSVRRRRLTCLKITSKSVQTILFGYDNSHRGLNEGWRTVISAGDSNYGFASGGKWYDDPFNLKVFKSFQKCPSDLIFANCYSRRNTTSASLDV